MFDVSVFNDGKGFGFWVFVVWMVILGMFFGVVQGFSVILVVKYCGIEFYVDVSFVYYYKYVFQVLMWFFNQVVNVIVIFIEI